MWFVYQDPIRAWEFTKAREVTDSRRVTKDVFIRAFIESRKNAIKVKKLFGSDLELNVLVKNYVEGEEHIRLNITATELDQSTDGVYSEETLTTLLV
ncbi:MAG: UDP-N-acetylglucosamine kinase [Patescibacteria group bacterium]|nr:UDP-N-acetylglucosamine kinase [Patescibacteria group bacterium]